MKLNPFDAMKTPCNCSPDSKVDVLSEFAGKVSHCSCVELRDNHTNNVPMAVNYGSAAVTRLHRCRDLNGGFIALGPFHRRDAAAAIALAATGGYSL